MAAAIERYTYFPTAWALDNDFDRYLYEGIQRAGEEAMGLIGARPLVSKVENINVTSLVEGHTYWGNREIMNKVVEVLK